MAHALEMVHDQNPKEVIWEKVGDRVKDVDVLGNLVLIGVYVRPKIMKSGSLFLELTDKTIEEDMYQGKVGMVLALGPIAFTDSAEVKFGGLIPRVGDWIVTNVSDAWPLELGKQRCRVAQDVHVKMIISHPDALW